MKRHYGILIAVLLTAASARAATSGDYGLEIVVDHSGRPEYRARGNVYVEALRDTNYSLRISNPTPFRVAVALAVDGLNTIDARHTDAWNASKWVLDPYETVEIEGWQVNDRTARRFVFTGESHSYGAALGKTENLGVIEAVFFRERPRVPEPWIGDAENQAGSAQSGAAPPSASRSESSKKAQADEYAATGMGDRTHHDVWSVSMDLLRDPVASIRIRYEFRAQLVKLGVLPAHPTPLDRRERARGFGAYCPEVD